MAGTTMRFISERGRGKSGGGAKRTWLALMLGLLAVLGALVVLTRDVAWDSRCRQARLLGHTAYGNGNYQAARTHYEEALANNPYDWESHYSLAQIFNHRLNDYEGALRHYLYALAYSPDAVIVESTKREINILRLIRSGELENPLEAVEDMFQSVESNARHAYLRRLELRLRRDIGAYWEGWRTRGRGEVVSTKITSNHEGIYDAAIELQFPDDTSMLLHLQSPLRDIWRLDLSFP